jgi:hypothetical protein
LPVRSYGGRAIGGGAGVDEASTVAGSGAPSLDDGPAGFGPKRQPPRLKVPVLGVTAEGGRRRGGPAPVRLTEEGGELVEDTGTALGGNSLGAAVAVGFHLLEGGSTYDAGCAITAAVGARGERAEDDELVGAAGLKAKLRAVTAWNQ